MSNNAASSFHAQLSGFRWANSVQDDSANASAQPGNNNMFSRTWSSVSGYIPLRNEGQSAEEEAYFALSVSAACARLDTLLTPWGFPTDFSDGNGECTERLRILLTPQLLRFHCLLSRRDGMFRHRIPLPPHP